jgi:hypothetical protein
MTDRSPTPDRFRAELGDVLVAHAATLPGRAVGSPVVPGRGVGPPAGTRRAARNRRRSPGAVRRLGPGVALAALVVAAVLTLGSTGTLRPAPATAAGVLNASAAALDHDGGSRALGPGDYFYSRIAVWWRYADLSPHPYVVRSVDEEWLARDGRGRSHYRVVGVSGTGASRRLPLTRSQDVPLRRPQARPFILSSAPAITLSYAELRRLPADPARLGAALDRIAARHHVDRLFPQRDTQVAIRFEMLRELAELPTSASLRAALYRLLATTPGIRLVGHARDSIGRPGTEVAVTVGDFRLEMIVDPATGELLQTSRTLLHRSPAYFEGRQPPGLVNRATYLAIGIVTSTHMAIP